MVAIVSGNTTGLLNSSGAILGRDGQYGNAITGNAREAVYINIATGNLALQDQDDFLAAQGLSLHLTRTYNSRGSFDDGDGVNWKLGVRKQVVEGAGVRHTAGHTVSRVDGDGSVSLFRYDSVVEQSRAEKK